MAGRDTKEISEQKKKKVIEVLLNAIKEPTKGDISGNKR